MFTPSMHYDAFICQKECGVALHAVINPSFPAPLTHLTLLCSLPSYLWFENWYVLRELTFLLVRNTSGAFTPLDDAHARTHTSALSSNYSISGYLITLQPQASMLTCTQEWECFWRANNISKAQHVLKWCNSVKIVTVHFLYYWGIRDNKTHI